MPEGALEIQVERIPNRSDQYTLTYHTFSYPITLDPSKSFTFTDLLRRLQTVLMGRSDPSHQLAPLELLWEVGIRLWQALFPDTASASVRESLSQELRMGLSPVLLSLPEELIELPWELLCDPEQHGERGFLARKRPLLRVVPGQTHFSPIQFPLRVLLLLSSPPSLGEDSRVDVESERAAVEEAVREACEAGLLHLMVEDIVTVQRVREALVRFKPHLLHYIGHGGYDEETGGFLLWEDERGNALPITDRHFADLLRPRHLAAVVLHACQTGRRNARSELRGVAGTLIHEGIPAVVSQQANFSYESSQRASKAWYSALTSGANFADAIFEVRQELSLAECPDWAVPVLQTSSASLLPLLDAQAVPGAPDPRLTLADVEADLPAPAGVFVGRHRELRVLRRLLEPASRQVMALVTGPGGIGKSTLVAQAITRYGKRYKGALTLSCLGYQDISLFLQRMGEFLKRQGVPGLLENTLADPQLSTAAKIENAIVAFNQAGPFLLVVDNLETVQREDQTLRDDNLLYFLQKLLTNLQRGHVLITGRYAVKDLLPQGKFATSLLHLDLDDLSGYETDQLMMRHASLAHLGEKLRQTLIHEFGGLPYIYDLLSSDAASQSLELLIRDVQGRITEERKKRSAAEWQEIRRQMVEFAALESTVACLPEPARTLLARISIFRRAFPLIALEQGLHATHAEWQPLLDWSLLRYDPSEKAYHLHSLTRRYAENLLAVQDCQHTQEQVATWYEFYADHDSHALIDYLEAHYFYRAAGNLRRADDLVSRLAQALGRAGLYAILKELFTHSFNDFRGTEQNRTAAALHGLGTLAREQGDYPEARRLYQASLDLQEQLGNLSGRATTLYQLGDMAREQGDYAEARRLYQESLALREQLGELKGRSDSLYGLGTLAREQGNYAEARRLYQESLALEEQLDDLSGRASSLYQLGILAQQQGDYPEARWHFQESLALEEQLSDLRGQASSLHQLGDMAREQGDYPEARRLYQASLALQEQLGTLSGRATTLHGLGMLAQEQGDYPEARRLYQESLALEEQLGDLRGRAYTLLQLGALAQLQSDYPEARRLYQESLALQEQLGNLSGRATTLQALGALAHMQDDYPEARRLYQASLTLQEQLGDLRGQAYILHGLGTLAKNQGDYPEARRLYQASLALQEQVGDLNIRAHILHGLGTLAQEQGDYPEAHRLYQASLALEEQLGNLRGRANSLGQLGNMMYEQGKIEEALIYTIQAYLIFEHLHDPNQLFARNMLATIRPQLGETMFMQYWRNLTSDHPLPSLPLMEDNNTQQKLIQTVIAFIQSPSWEASRQFLWEHPELLQPKIDTLLQALAAQLEQADIRKIIENHRHILARCREQGIDAVFTELTKAKSAETFFLDELNILCTEVVTMLLNGNAQQRENLAQSLEQRMQTPLPVEGAEVFLQVLAAWLRGHSDQAARDSLPPLFADVYKRMVTALERVEVQDKPQNVNEREGSENKNQSFTTADVTHLAATIKQRGTSEHRHQLVGILTEVQQQLSAEEAPLKLFLGCLIAVLHDEAPDISSLEAPYTELWQAFLNDLTSQASEESE